MGMETQAVALDTFFSVEKGIVVVTVAEALMLYKPCESGIC